jgi:hypothetical protein
MSDVIEKSAGYTDEKGQVESASDQETALHKGKTPEEKKLVRKLDVRILPITCILYLFACGLWFFSCTSQPLTDFA